jgi:SAM-dependent methyltransferase
MGREVNFDGIARAYRWMEYAALGPMLMRTRREFLGRMGGARRALVLGDGDGRFTAALLQVNRRVTVDAVDSSGAMLGLLRERVEGVGAGDRLRVHCENALGFEVEEAVDLITTHFFLDCLTQEEVDGLAGRLVSAMAPGGRWVVSEFRVPEGWLGWLAGIYVGFLYWVFGVLTGLRVRRLPDYAGAMRRAGLVRVAARYRLFGILLAEVWERGDDY